MEIKICKSSLNGKVQMPGSKSQTIRAIIGAALSSGNSYIENVSICNDVTAAIGAVTALGAKVEFFADNLTKKNCLKISGNNYHLINEATIDCKDSATVLRFFLSIVAVLGIKTKFIMSSSLMKRPLDDLIKELTNHGINYRKNVDNCSIISDGKISGDNFFINANISSQYISGLLFALPLCKANSCNNHINLHLTSEICSKQYLNMTLDILNKFGINIKYKKKRFEIAKAQKFKKTTITIEGDYSIAANFFVAQNINSKNLIIENLPQKTIQKEKIILDIIKNINTRHEISIDADDYIDIVPILVVLFCYKKIKGTILNIKRLKIKESNRLESICESLIKMGADISYTNNKIFVNGKGQLTGGVRVNGYNDHRIVMALTVAGLAAQNPIIISDAESVNKSFPEFNDIIHNLSKNNIDN